MSPHGSEENGLNWDDGIVPYNLLETALDETVARYAHLYSYGAKKANFSLIGLVAQFSILRIFVAPLVIN